MIKLKAKEAFEIANNKVSDFSVVEKLIEDAANSGLNEDEDKI